MKGNKVSYYQLFCSLQNYPNGKNLNSLEACQNHLDQFITEKDANFWGGGWNHEVTSNMANNGNEKALAE